MAAKPEMQRQPRVTREICSGNAVSTTFRKREESRRFTRTDSQQRLRDAVIGQEHEVRYTALSTQLTMRLR
jgi:hypothetical protein